MFFYHLKPYRNVSDPRALAEIFAKAEADLANRSHPDPYIGI
jgi:NADH dehydrogenase (ubiquinone) 1 beta subcomplex subunit 9